MPLLFAFYFVPRRFAVRGLVPVFFVAVRAGFAVFVVRVAVFFAGVRFVVRPLWFRLAAIVLTPD